jgi:hypothetical protein
LPRDAAVGEGYDILTQGRADGHRRRENLGRYARPGSQPGCDKFEEAKRCQHARFVFQQAACGLVAAAVGRDIAEHPDHRDQESRKRALNAPDSERACGWTGLRDATQAGEQHAREHAAVAAVYHGGDQSRPMKREHDQPRMNETKVWAVAMDRHGDQASKHDGCNDQATVALLRSGRQFFDDEHNAAAAREPGRDARAAGTSREAAGGPDDGGA